MRTLLRRRLVEPVRALLLQGLTPEKLALSLALGAVIGLFPVMGVTTALCVAVGAAFKLSHPALQIANYAMYPIQIPLILAFVRLGERFAGAPPMPFTVASLVAAFRADPAGFLARFGLTGLHGILGWLATAPLLGLLLYAALLPLLRLAARRLAPRPETPA